MAGTARLIRVLKRTFDPRSHMVGDCEQSLYAVDPPMVEGWPDEGEKAAVYPFVVVSAVRHQWAHETYIFPADEDGEIADWGELPGSFQGGMDHAEALRGAGYEIVEEAADDSAL